MNERPKVNLQIVFFCQFGIRVLVIFWFWQRNQNAFNLSLSIFQLIIVLKFNQRPYVFSALISIKTGQISRAQR